MSGIVDEYAMTKNRLSEMGEVVDRLYYSIQCHL